MKTTKALEKRIRKNKKNEVNTIIVKVLKIKPSKINKENEINNQREEEIIKYLSNNMIREIKKVFK